MTLEIGESLIWLRHISMAYSSLLESGSEIKLHLRRIDGVIQVRYDVDPTLGSLLGFGRSREPHISALLENPYFFINV